MLCSSNNIEENLRSLVPDFKYPNGSYLVPSELFTSVFVDNPEDSLPYCTFLFSRSIQNKASGVVYQSRIKQAELFVRCVPISSFKILYQTQTLLLRTQHIRSITMASKVNNSFPIKSLSPQGTRNNMLLSKKLKSAIGGQPLGNVETSSDSSIKSESTTSTEQEFRVRFSGKVHGRNTLSYRDYSTEEIQACWYTAEENQRIQRHCSKEIHKMEEGSNLKDKKYCSRGLERHTAVGAAIKARNRRLVINAVLDEQMIQWEKGIFDEDTIAEIYFRASSSCQMRAYIVGLGDHRATEAYVESCLRIARGPLAPSAA